VTGKPIIRCAIYTRKSTEEGLEQDFNSLDAQREACEAYAASQKAEGWMALANRYDDGGTPAAHSNVLPSSACFRILSNASSTWWWSTRSTG
jgi:DNA invertase Pin-like site-specific DNA recombinase